MLLNVLEIKNTLNYPKGILAKSSARRKVNLKVISIIAYNGYGLYKNCKINLFKNSKINFYF